MSFSSTRSLRSDGPAPTRKAEGLMFLALSVLVWPVIAVAGVGAYGFSIWFYQILTH